MQKCTTTELIYKKKKHLLEMVYYPQLPTNNRNKQFSKQWLPYPLRFYQNQYCQYGIVLWESASELYCNSKTPELGTHMVQARK